MSNNFVFSWAENAQGKMVHVDDGTSVKNANFILIVSE